MNKANPPSPAETGGRGGKEDGQLDDGVRPRQNGVAGPCIAPEQRRFAPLGEAAAHGGKVYIATMPQDTGRVPDVVGMGARDAVFCLEQAGLRVKLNGVGAVTRQSIKAGSPLVAGQVVELELKANRKARKAEPRPAPPAPVDTVAPPSTGQKARSDSAAPRTPVKKQSGTPAKQNDRQQACLFEGRQRHVPAKPIRNA